MLKKEPITKPLSNLIEIMQFTENVSTKIHGVLDKNEIFRIVVDEFRKSKKYTCYILLLTDDQKSLRIVNTTISPFKIKAAERLIGLRMKDYTIQLDKSRFLSQVVREGKTIQANVNDLIGELFPQSLAFSILQLFYFENAMSIITPLELHNRIIGSFTMTSTKLVEHFIPSVKNLSRHISSALELAEENSSRLKLENLLAHERDLLQALMNNIPDAIFFKDDSSRFTRINRAQAKNLGLENPEEAVGKTDFDFFVPEHARDAFNNEQEIIKKGQLLVGKVEKSERIDGQFRWVSTTKVPIKDQKAQVIGLVGISRDVTERKKMEDELKRYSENLEELVKLKTEKLKESERLAAIGETAAMVGHDLANPLQVISNQLYIGKKMLDQIPDECKKAAIEKGILKLFEGVAEQIHYMSKLINDLRDYARPIKFEPVAVDVKNLITETLSTLSIPENIKTTIDVEEKLVSIAFMADPILLKRILINLLTNAVQSMVNGGKLTVKASLADETISISVEDTGAGIPKENLGKLFEPLFTTKAKGAGLGLAVCKRLIEAHEGSITVESEVGKGPIFTIHIPFRRAT